MSAQFDDRVSGRWKAGVAPRLFLKKLVGDEVLAQRRVSDQSLNPVLRDWSPDGRDRLYSVFVSFGFELWRLPLDTRKPVRLTNLNIGMHANFSPDGQFVSYTSDDSGSAEVYVQTHARRAEVRDHHANE